MRITSPCPLCEQLKHGRQAASSYFDSFPLSLTKMLLKLCLESYRLKEVGELARELSLGAALPSGPCAAIAL